MRTTKDKKQWRYQALKHGNKQMKFQQQTGRRPIIMHDSKQGKWFFQKQKPASIIKKALLKNQWILSSVTIDSIQNRNIPVCKNSKQAIRVQQKMERVAI